jgi:pectate lyase
MTTKKKIILLAVIVLVLVAVMVGYYFYTKGPIDVKGASGKKISAIELYKTFSTDSLSAKKQFLEKILEVSGTVVQVSQNQQNQAIVLLKTTTEGASVNCTLEGATNAVKEGDNISIKGICSGMGEGDVDMGITGDVYLIRCYMVK